MNRSQIEAVGPSTSPRTLERLIAGGALGEALRSTHVALAPRLGRALEALARAEWERREAARAGLTDVATQYEAARERARAAAVRAHVPVDA